jgi:hypothetical protein
MRERANFFEAAPLPSPPEVLERRRAQLRVARRVLDRPVAEPVLNVSRVVAGVGQGVAAGSALPLLLDAPWPLLRELARPAGRLREAGAA